MSRGAIISHYFPSSVAGVHAASQGQPPSLALIHPHPPAVESRRPELGFLSASANAPSEAAVPPPDLFRRLRGSSPRLVIPGCLGRTSGIRQRKQTNPGKGHRESIEAVLSVAFEHDVSSFPARRVSLPGRVPGRLAGRFMHVMLTSAPGASADARISGVTQPGHHVRPLRRSVVAENREKRLQLQGCGRTADMCPGGSWGLGAARFEDGSCVR